MTVASEPTPVALPARMPLAPEMVIVLVALVAWTALPGREGLATGVLSLGLLAMSLNLVLGLGGILSLGQAGFWGIGAYGAAYMALHTSADPLLGLAVGALAGGLLALVSGVLVVGAPGVFAAVITLLIARLLGETAIASEALGGQSGLTPPTPTPLPGLGVSVENQIFFLALGLVLLASLFLRRLDSAPFGLVMRALAENPTRVQAMGIAPRGRRLLVFLIGGVLAGMAGALLLFAEGEISPSVFSFAHSFEALGILILGGVRRPWAAIPVAAIYVLVADVARLLPFGEMLALALLLLAAVVAGCRDRGAVIQ